MLLLSDNEAPIITSNVVVIAAAAARRRSGRLVLLGGQEPEAPFWEMRGEEADLNNKPERLLVVSIEGQKKVVPSSSYWELVPSLWR